MSVLVRVSGAVKRHRDHSSSYKGKAFNGVTYSSELQPVLLVGLGSVKEGVVLEKEPRVLHLAQVTGSELRHWAQFEHI